MSGGVEAIEPCVICPPGPPGSASVWKTAFILSISKTVILRLIFGEVGNIDVLKLRIKTSKQKLWDILTLTRPKFVLLT